MRRVFLTALILCIFAQPCYAGMRAKKEVKEGNILYNKGEFEEALKKYEAAFLDLPDSDVVNFDLGTALYKTEDYKAAIEHFEKSLISEDPSLEQKASYNIGNAKYKHGIGKEDTDLQAAVNLLEESLRHYEHAIELDQKDEDAKHNYEFVKKELERLKKKLKQQPQPQQRKQPEEKEEQEKKRPEEQKEEEKPRPEEPEEQEGKPESEEEKEPEPQEALPQKPTAEMTEKEAQMLLDDYRHEEEPKGMYKEKVPTRGLPEVLKDW